MKFYTTTLEITDRFTEPINELVNGQEMYNSEEIYLNIKLIGSGDTSNFTSNEIGNIIMDRLREITKQ